MTIRRTTIKFSTPARKARRSIVLRHSFSVMHHSGGVEYWKWRAVVMATDVHYILLTELKLTQLSGMHKLPPQIVHLYLSSILYTYISLYSAPLYLLYSIPLYFNACRYIPDIYRYRYQFNIYQYCMRCGTYAAKSSYTTKVSLTLITNAEFNLK